MGVSYRGMLPTGPPLLTAHPGSAVYSLVSIQSNRDDRRIQSQKEPASSSGPFYSRSSCDSSCRGERKPISPLTWPGNPCWSPAPAVGSQPAKSCPQRHVAPPAGSGLPPSPDDRLGCHRSLAPNRRPRPCAARIKKSSIQILRWGFNPTARGPGPLFPLPTIRHHFSAHLSPRKRRERRRFGSAAEGWTLWQFSAAAGTRRNLAAGGNEADESSGSSAD